MPYALTHIPQGRWKASKGHVLNLDTDRTLCGVSVYTPSWVTRKPSLMGDTERSLISCQRCKASYMKLHEDDPA